MSSWSPSSERTHLRELLAHPPRHVVFHARLVIHELSSVPLISGQFRVKWQFSNLQAVNNAGQPLGLGRALVRKLEKRHGSDSSAKGKEVAPGERRDDLPPFPKQSHLPHEDEMLTMMVPADADSRDDEDTPTPPLVRPGSSHSSSQSSHSKPSLNGRTSASEAPSIDYRTDPQGYTPFLPLQDFKIAFDHQVDAAVQMSIDKESLALLPSELKLTVKQRVIPGDPDSPHNPRLGHVIINLSEYVNSGSVTRNYLLRKSKVNAVLNMTITMTQISGRDDFRAPPLRKEEIGAGLTNFVSLFQPVPALSRFTHIEDPWLEDARHLFFPQQQQRQESPPPEPPPTVDPPTAEKRGRWRGSRRTKSDEQQQQQQQQTPAAPPPSSPSSPGLPKQTTAAAPQEPLHPTEALIEAIFNPVPSPSPTPTPFTYYRPPSPLTPPPYAPSEDTEGTSRGSFDSSRHASTSEVGHESGCGGSGSGTSRWWQRRNVSCSRPVTPARSNSGRSGHTQ